MTCKATHITHDGVVKSVDGPTSLLDNGLCVVLGLITPEQQAMLKSFVGRRVQFEFNHHLCEATATAYDTKETIHTKPSPKFDPTNMVCRDCNLNRVAKGLPLIEDEHREHLTTPVDSL